MADEYNNSFNGFNAGNVFSDHSRETYGTPAFAVPAGLAENEQAEEQAPVETQAEEAQAEQPAAKPAAKEAKEKKPAAANRKPSPSGEITEKTVRTVLSMLENVDLLDGKVRAVAAYLLGVKNPEDKVKFIVAMADDAKVSKARSVIRDLSELCALDEMQFAVKTSVREHSERKALWEVESRFDEDKAAELGKFPANDVFAEVTMLRKLQKESPSFKQTLDDLVEVLA